MIWRPMIHHVKADWNYHVSQLVTLSQSRKNCLCKFWVVALFGDFCIFFFNQFLTHFTALAPRRRPL